MVHMEDLKRWCELHRFVRLRQRYILTRHNKVRVRYVLGYSCSLAMAFAMAWTNAGTTQGPRIISAYEVALSGYLMNEEAARVAQTMPASGEQKVAPAVQPVAVAAAAVADPVPTLSLAENVQNRISEGIRKASFIIKKPDPSYSEDVEISRGDTIGGVLEKAGVSSDDAYQAVEALRKHMNPRNVHPGQVINIQFTPGATEEDAHFARMTMDVDPLRKITVRKEKDSFVSDVKEKDVKARTYASYAKIENSLYGSAERAGIPPQILAQVIKLYSRNIDFQRDIQKGDEIRVLYDGEETDDGGYRKYGNILYASLTVGGRDVPLYRYDGKDGRADYYDEKGRTTRKALLKTPIDGARVSSGFGMRRHPILGYTKMHKGIDFAAPTGTPIYASGDGIVDFAGRKSGYGNFVMLRHNSELKTGYGHMSRIARNVRSGSRVRQGDVIGYVGATGRATGPHLHYEVVARGRQVNPRSIDLPTGENLAGRDLKRFQDAVAGLRQRYAYLTEGIKVAQTDVQATSRLN